MKSWKVVITNPAERALRAVPRGDLEHINFAFEDMSADPYSGDIKFLRGEKRTVRRRVGAWRILFKVDTEKRLIVIFGVLRRLSNTY